jgi:serine protease SohB
MLSLFEKHPRVALVRLSGLIAARGGAFQAPGLSAASLTPVLERAFALKRLAAVALAINSPGGSPVQSSLIAAQIRRLADKKKVPVIAYVEDAAASGGYWLACAADEIVVDPSSVVGSIGVISSGFGLRGAIERLGVERRLHTAGTEKSFLDPFGPERPEDVQRLDALLAELHASFKGWVRSRRGGRLKVPEDEAFTGRFWTGARAVELGLADRIGEMRAELQARFGEKARIVPVGVRRPPWPLRLFAPSVLAEGVIAAAEERAAWSRLGL